MKFKKTPNQNRVYIKLEDGESIQGVFLGEPNEFYVNKGMGNFSKYDSPAPDRTYKFELNFYCLSDSPPSLKIFQGGMRVRGQIEAITAKRGDSVVINIFRSGTGKQTTYSLSPVRMLTEEEKINIQNIKLIPLGKQIQKEDEEELNFQENPNIPLPPIEDEDDISF